MSSKPTYARASPNSWRPPSGRPRARQVRAAGQAAVEAEAVRLASLEQRISDVTRGVDRISTQAETQV